MEFFEFFNKVGRILYLSILWFIACIPIVTIGASTTAYCYMMNKTIWDREGYLTKGFIKAFKENFKCSTAVWMILLILGILISANMGAIYYMAKTSGGIYGYFIPFYIMLLVLLWATLIYVFPYIAKFENTTLETIKNSFLMATRHLGYTLVIMVINIAALIFGFGIFLLASLVVPAVIGFVNVAILNLIFRRYEK